MWFERAIQKQLTIFVEKLKLCFQPVRWFLQVSLWYALSR